MQIEGEYEIAAPPARVWRELNDPETLRACIPGCEDLEADGDGAWLCRVTARYGPVKARFHTRLSIEQADPPHTYVLAGEGRGGVAGFGQGRAEVWLEPLGGGTRLRYAARLSVGGKLAQVGSRFTASTTRNLSDRFFDAFCARFETGGEET